MTSYDIDDILNHPSKVGESWLTKAYIAEHGWIPMPDELLEFPNNYKLAHTFYGALPCKSRDEFRAGDVIIFEDGDICTIMDDDIEQYKNGERELLPCGVVVPNPTRTLLDSLGLN